MSGSVRIARSLFDDAAFKDEPMTEREAFIWMIMEASFKARERRVGSVSVSLERGQMAASTRFMATAWRWSEARVRRYLERLKNRRMVTCKTDAGITVVTVCKYEEYQSSHNNADAATTHHATQQRRTGDANENKDEINDIREPKGSLSSDEISQAVSDYNTAASVAGWPQVKIVSKSRRSSLQNRLRECGGIEGWRDALRRARASPHLCGDNDRGWTADFDFLVTQSKFAKLMEGSYDARQPTTTAHRSRHPGRSSPHDALLRGFQSAADRYDQGG